MPNLYEIEQAIYACIDMETGEVIDLEALEALTMQREAKLENVALWIKNLRSDEAALKAEIDAFKSREQSVKRKRESLEKWLTAALGGEKFTTARCAVAFRKSSSVEVLDVASLPEKYQRHKVTVEADKTAIKEALKSGHEIAGCRIVENTNISIK